MNTRYQIIFWLLLTLSATGYFAQSLIMNESHPDFLPGETSHGHYQIELACESCHTEAFGDEKVLQNACLNCHKEELKEANDSHPIKKFTDPRNADRLAILDARYCISCHKEHVPDHTREMGVTLPNDFCEACHSEIATERPSHKGMGFDTCASAGCHNYHDNKALYENFLLKHSNEADTKALAAIIETISDVTQLKTTDIKPDFPSNLQPDAKTLHEWENSAHALAEINCTDCHSTKSQPNLWIDKPELDQCKSCHSDQVSGFTSGKHGMRMRTKINGDTLPAMTVGESQLFQQGKMHITAFDNQLTCNSCHDAHTFDRKQAAVEACLNCHNDDHSRAYNDSKHSLLSIKNDQSIVTCATCHLPKVEVEKFGEKTTIVQHNQNHNLKPNEKMIRSVCLDCHGLSFSIDALADPVLIERNFNGKPSIHIKSIDMALERDKP